MTRLVIAAACGLAILVSPTRAEEKPPVELRLKLLKDKYPWPYATAGKEFADRLQGAVKRKGDLPKPPPIDAVLQFTNTGKERATIHVGGDPNTFTLTLKGDGVITADPGLAFTTDFRMPKAVELEPGKSHEIPIRLLADGHRMQSRYIYPTAPGEYTLSAAYGLSTADAGKGPVLKSNEVKFRIGEPRK